MKPTSTHFTKETSPNVANRKKIRPSDFIEKNPAFRVSVPRNEYKHKQEQELYGPRNIPSIANQQQ